MKRKILLVSVIAIMIVTGVFAAINWINVVDNNKPEIVSIDAVDDNDKSEIVSIDVVDDNDKSEIVSIDVVDDNKIEYLFKFEWSKDFTKCTRIKSDTVLRRNGSSIKEYKETTDISCKITINPTCESDGQKYYIAKFDDGQTVSSDLVNIPALGHSKVNFDTATCGKEGTKGQKCTRCNKEFDVKSSKATGNHTPGDFVIIKEPTCTEPGSKQQVCNVCGEILKKETIPAKGHDYDNWQEIEGEESCIRKCKTCSFEETCEHEDSITTEWNAVNDEQCVCSMFCTKCGKVLEEGLPENHVWMPSRDTSDFFECANCHIKKCFTFEWSEDFTKCTRIMYDESDYSSYKETTDISDEIITEPTCENYGQKKYTAKFDDGQIVSSGLVNIPALGHYKENFDTATCGKEGTKGQRCTRCNKEFDVKSSEATGKHTPGDFEITKEPTCTEPGSKQQVCNVCGEILKKETIPAKGHDYDNWQEIEGEESCIRKCKTCSFEETCEHEDSITTEWNAVNDEQCVCSMFCTKCGKVLEEGLPENHVWMPSRDTSDFFECANCHIKRRFTESDK